MNILARSALPGVWQALLRQVPARNSGVDANLSSFMIALFVGVFDRSVQVESCTPERRRSHTAVGLGDRSGRSTMSRTSILNDMTPFA
jgi:hypothetical protein